jgi:hypothetical protein
MVSFRKRLPIAAFLLTDDQDEWSCDDSSSSVELDDDKSMMDILFEALEQSTKNWRWMAQMMELDMIMDMALEFPDNPTFARAAERKLLEFFQNDYGDDHRPNKKFKANTKSSNQRTKMANICIFPGKHEPTKTQRQPTILSKCGTPSKVPFISWNNPKYNTRRLPCYGTM